MIQSDLTRDGWLLFATRCARMFGYGVLSVVLVLYLAAIRLTGWQIGLLLTLTLAGDTLISLWLTTTADRQGRRRTLILGAILMVMAGFAFISTSNFYWLVIAATIGVISPSGNEIGPFLSVEQACLSEIVSDERRPDVFAWYNLAGSFATASGAFVGGVLTEFCQWLGLAGAAAFRPVLLIYVAVGVLLAIGFRLVSSAVEPAFVPDAASGTRKLLGLHQSKRTVFTLAGLFAVDAFGGGFVIQSVVAYWFYLRFGVEPAMIGTIFLFANLLAGVSALAAGWLARRIGLVNTMVFTHLPSNLLLMLVPLMPTVWWAIAVLLLRFAISQMDVPTRQAYMMSVVRPDERSAAAGVTSVARSIGASLSPMLATVLISQVSLMAVPFFLAGGLKIIYDIGLYCGFAYSRSTGKSLAKVQ